MTDFFFFIEKMHEICNAMDALLKDLVYIGFSTLAGMEQAVEGNHGNDLKEG